jgi:hypothetical protein
VDVDVSGASPPPAASKAAASGAIYPTMPSDGQGTRADAGIENPPAVEEFASGVGAAAAGVVWQDRQMNLL